MARKRLTQRFPFLLPLRRWERRRMFYLKMRMDGNRYAGTRSERELPFTYCEASDVLINRNSGYDIKYQLNKVHNLRLAAGTVDGVLIRPGETFSFWRLARDADRDEPYRDGLLLVDGRIVPSYGGGLCQMSNLLYWLFLHTPLTVTERRGHPVEGLPPNSGELPHGVDATIIEGWTDLKVRNDTGNTFQIRLGFDEERIYGRVMSRIPADRSYRVVNTSLTYERRGGEIYELAEVARAETDMHTGECVLRPLYTNECRITYALPEGTHIEEVG